VSCRSAICYDQNNSKSRQEVAFFMFPLHALWRSQCCNSSNCLHGTECIGLATGNHCNVTVITKHHLGSGLPSPQAKSDPHLKAPPTLWQLYHARRSISGWYF
jgi:hypothetical protein